MCELLRDENGKMSSTRLTLYVFTLLFSFTVWQDVMGSAEVNDHIYNTMYLVFAICLGGNTIKTSAKNWMSDVSTRKQ